MPDSDPSVFICVHLWFHSLASLRPSQAPVARMDAAFAVSACVLLIRPTLTVLGVFVMDWRRTGRPGDARRCRASDRLARGGCRKTCGQRCSGRSGPSRRTGPVPPDWPCAGRLECRVAWPCIAPLGVGCWRQMRWARSFAMAGALTLHGVFPSDWPRVGRSGAARRAPAADAARRDRARDRLAWGVAAEFAGSLVPLWPALSRCMGYFIYFRIGCGRAGGPGAA